MSNSGRLHWRETNCTWHELQYQQWAKDNKNSQPDVRLWEIWSSGCYHTTKNIDGTEDACHCKVILIRDIQGEDVVYENQG